MTRHGQLIEVLISQNIVSMESLCSKLSFSERRIREMLRELRQDEEENGFKIVTVSKEGYFLRIIDKDRFSRFLENESGNRHYNVGRKDYRISLILFLLLQNEGFISLNQIAEILDVSRNTILNDLDEVKARLQNYQIQLDSKPHYGVKVTGAEKDIRKMLSRISGSIVEHQSIPMEFVDFVTELDFTAETEKFVSLLDEYNIVMTNNAIESIMFHQKILIYRIEQKNYINEININRQLIDTSIYEIAEKIIAFIEEKHNIKATKEEVDMVASQIFGKASSETIPFEQKEEMAKSIQESLIKVDRDYATNFSSDVLLQENLLMHLFPLIMRVSFGLELNDSLVGSISVQYMNAFLVAMRFIDYHSQLKNYELSRDEIGYLALHFVTHAERESQKKLQRIRKIVLVTDGMRSSTILFKTKLQSHFPLATILEIPYAHAKNHKMEDVELVISTIELQIAHQEAKLVIVNESLTDQEIRKIKNKVLFSEMNFKQETLSLDDLFHEELFLIKDGGEYYSLIEEMCNKMVALDYAKEGFTESVIQREKRFLTIYENGIASPHSLIQLANTDSIGVILLRNAIYYDKKEVRCILVLNVKKGHLLIHQEISDFVVQLMNDRTKIKLLQQANLFQEFKMFLEDIL